VKRSRRRAAQALFAWPLAALIARAAGAAEPAPHKKARVNYEYRVINPQPVATGDRIEVIEFFWYGCPYCNALQPSLESWLKRKPSDVEFRRLPAVFRPSWVPHARVFYTLETLGELDRLHQDVYRSYHVEGDRLNTPDSTADWAARRGIDRARWVSTFESAEVNRKVEQSLAATRNYVIEGTPSLVVDGRFVTSTGMTETIAGVFPILDDLIVMARERQAGRDKS
jgi:protein dithiol oxidoreductase (disulfide-forming)